MNTNLKSDKSSTIIKSIKHKVDIRHFVIIK